MGETESGGVVLILGARGERTPLARMVCAGSLMPLYNRIDEIRLYYGEVRGPPENTPMAKIDVLYKDFLNDSEVFAGICNLTFFNGRKVVTKEDLVELSPEMAVSLGFGRRLATFHLQRDMLKGIAPGGGPLLLIVGLEAQSHEDCAMPLRCLVYDAMGCLIQARDIRDKRRNICPEKEFVPLLVPEESVVQTATIVVNVGDKPWSTATEASAIVRRPGRPWKVAPFIYKMNVISLCEQTDRKLKGVCLKLRCVCKCLRAVNDPDGLERMLEHDRDFRHVPVGIAPLMSVILGKKFRIDRNKETFDMCHALDVLEARAVQKGRAEGIKKGVLQGFRKGHREGRAEGRAEGRVEGRAEGRVEGRAEGRAEGHKEGIEKGEQIGIEKSIRRVVEAMSAANASPESIASFLVNAFSITSEEAERYLRPVSQSLCSPRG